MNYTTCIFLIATVSGAYKYRTCISTTIMEHILRLSICLAAIKVARRNIGTMGLIKMSTKTLIYYLKTKLGLASSVTMDKKYCYISYSYNGRNHIVKYPRKRKNNFITAITDSKGDDVTECVKQYMGVGNNFHGILTTPEMLGYSSLTFHNIKGESLTYNNDSIIFF